MPEENYVQEDFDLRDLFITDDELIAVRAVPGTPTDLKAVLVKHLLFCKEHEFSIEDTASYLLKNGAAAHPVSIDDTVYYISYAKHEIYPLVVNEIKPDKYDYEFAGNLNGEIEKIELQPDGKTFKTDFVKSKVTPRYTFTLHHLDRYVFFAQEDAENTLKNALKRRT